MFGRPKLPPTNEAPHKPETGLELWVLTAMVLAAFPQPPRLSTKRTGFLYPSSIRLLDRMESCSTNCTCMYAFTMAVIVLTYSPSLGEISEDRITGMFPR